jgi:hypothetical protein
MSFDFAVETTEVSTTTTEDAEDTEETPEFVSSEVPEIYLSLGDWKALLGEMLEALDLEALKIYSDDTLEDASRLLGEYSEAHPMQQLHMVASLAKSTAGKMQRETDHGIGLSGGKVPESHYEESFSYALYYSDLPSISWDDLDGGERENLEEMGIEPSEVGFDTTYGGPKLLVIDGKRLPIAVEEGNEVLEALEILQMVPDEPSHWTEDGFVESSHPEVFGEKTDKGSEGDSEADSGSDDEVFNLAANPERVKEVNVSDLRGQGPEEFSVTNITNLRAIQTMLRVESGSDNPRKGAMTRLKERRNALQNSRRDGGVDTETASGASEDEVEEAVDGVEEDELTEADKNLMATLVQDGQAEDLEDAKEKLQSL